MSLSSVIASKFFNLTCHILSGEWTRSTMSLERSRAPTPSIAEGDHNGIASNLELQDVEAEPPLPDRGRAAWLVCDSGSRLGYALHIPHADNSLILNAI